MKPAPLPSNESERLKALNAYQLLDTLPEAVYDDITKIATEICGTPIALLTLVDKDRQWFKSRQGLDIAETPREYSFCAHAIINPDEALIVPDARYDERFHDNPLTTGEPHVVFYAGIPIKDEDGHALGSLCVIDNRPRELPGYKIDALKALAKLATAHFELRKAKIALHESRERDNRTLEAVNSMLTTIQSLLNSNPTSSQLSQINTLQSTLLSLKLGLKRND